ncbi:SIMPL domain-containing protein [Oscillatoriales cyanobacterium LEGE 11467]|uniref:SIMPL domain-containing protein n=1 Tax=Zarconia navalis LEGE 11467 TaxID=1828826 RepID=A0A928VWK6_9CYAN|nr:SIMPL domain-containing protein [Zarconia navalis]MBE9041466.1 SIMPL domain-containing protein [Zarconia navalis LEGE 11467]
MKAIGFSNVLVAAVASTAMATGLYFSSSATATTTSQGKPQLSQLFTGDRRMITTYGRGIASATAEKAEIRLYFNRPETYLEDGSLSPNEPIARAEMQRIVETLMAAGVAEDAVEIDLNPSEPYYYGPSGANLVVTLLDPTQEEIDRILQIAQAINLDDENLYYNYSNNYCSLEDVTGLENEARISAIEDARRRIDAMAGALGVRVMDVLAAVEVHSYTPISTSCYPADNSISGDDGRPTVQIELGILVTYGIR